MRMIKVALLFCMALSFGLVGGCAVNVDPGSEVVERSEIQSSITLESVKGSTKTPMPFEDLSPELQQSFLDKLGAAPNMRIICDVGGGCANCCSGGHCCASCNGEPAVCF